MLDLSNCETMNDDLDWCRPSRFDFWALFICVNSGFVGPSMYILLKILIINQKKSRYQIYLLGLELKWGTSRLLVYLHHVWDCHSECFCKLDRTCTCVAWALRLFESSEFFESEREKKKRKRNVRTSWGSNGHYRILQKSKSSQAQILVLRQKA